MSTTLSVLIVTDHRDGAGSLTAALSRHGHTVRTVHTTAEARGDLMVPPDVVLLDIDSADGDGFDLAERFSRLTLRPLVVVRATGGLKPRSPTGGGRLDADWIVGLLADFGRGRSSGAGRDARKVLSSVGVAITRTGDVADPTRVALR